MSHFAERAARYAACLLWVLAVSGCGSEPSGEATKTGGESSANDSVSTEGSGEFVLGDLVEPFETPATLEELDEGVEWVDSPVVDSLALLREQKKSEPALVSVEEALAMKNDSAEANQKILSALSALAPKDGSGVNYDAVLNRAIQQDLRSLNPILSSSMSESEISSLTAFGLFSFDWNFTPFASSDVVVSWQTSKDRMYDKVVIRDDLAWSDGEPITAHDVEFSFKVIMSSKVPVPAQRQGTDQLKAVKAYDDHTLVYFQEKPLATNVWNLNFAIIPKHIYGESIADDPTLRTSDYHIQQEKSPVYGGPYEIEKRERGSSIVLKRRESWYLHDGEQVRDKPYFAKVWQKKIKI